MFQVRRSLLVLGWKWKPGFSASLVGMEQPRADNAGGWRAGTAGRGALFSECCVPGRPLRGAGWWVRRILSLGVRGLLALGWPCSRGSRPSLALPRRVGWPEERPGSLQGGESVVEPRGSVRFLKKGTLGWILFVPILDSSQVRAATWCRVLISSNKLGQLLF